METINISKFNISRRAIINKDSGYIYHDDGREFYYEYFINRFNRRQYKAIPTTTAEGEPYMDADWVLISFAK